MATVLPGLEDIAVAELTAKLGLDTPSCQTSRGKVFARSALAPAEFTMLRSIDNLYLLIATLEVGPHRVHLADFAAAVSHVDFDAAVRLAGLEPSQRLSIFVNASRVGKHTYSRFELSEAATQGVLARRRRWVEGTADAHEAEFRVDLTGDQALLSLRLTPPTFRYRGNARGFTEAALRPTVAHALVWLSGLAAGERFLDPFCGSGTIVAERGAYPAASVTGSDIDEEVVRTARANAPDSVVINCWDARHLPIDSGSVDTIVTNLPFGRQILTPGDIGPLYAAFCQELRRVLTPAGRGWLLTDQNDELNRAAVASQLTLADVRQLSLKGLHPHLFLVTKS